MKIPISKTEYVDREWYEALYQWLVEATATLILAAVLGFFAVWFVLMIGLNIWGFISDKYPDITYKSFQTALCEND